ncbi:hydrolase [Thermococcus radiotolerans]|uniref:Hydrolase n=1 Tax=Thermococcus radiotolerans TaxID=187880 RepID=A0A2Z2NCA0_9EURY|nr:hydrolase [Thermococcus radiotolerans]ASJ15419.1 hydrolase [Thermococcus radiotolerans]
MKRRGFIFTLDAILALLLVTMFVVSITQINPSTQVYSTYMRSQSKYLAEDSLTTMRTQPLWTFVPPGVIKNWTDDGTLNLALVSPDMSPIDIVATYWATAPLFPGANLTHKAEVILGYILNSTLKDYNYELLINNYTSPYLRKVGSNYSAAQDVTPATLILSGYAFNQTPRGYMARAFLNKLGSKENTYTIRGGYIESAAPDSDEHVTIKYVIPAGTIPRDAVIEEVKWFIEGAWVDSTYRLYVNGNPVTCTGEITGNQYDQWSLVEANDLVRDSTNGDSCNLVEVVQDAISNGQEVVFEVQNYNDNYYYNRRTREWYYRGGEDAAQYVTVKYKTSTPSTLKFPKKFYLDDVTSNYGIEYWKFLMVPGILTGMNIQVAAENISPTDNITLRFVFTNEVNVSPTYCQYNITTEIKTCYWTNATISQALSGAGYNYSQISGKWVVLKFFIGGNGDESSKDLEYSKRIRLIRDLSFIEADYTPGVLLTSYTIDITEPISLPNQDWTDSVAINFNVPQGTTPLWVRFQFPWRYYAGTTPYQTMQISNPLLVAPTYIYCYDGGGDITCNPSNPFTHFAQIGYSKDSFDYKYDPLPNAIAPGDNSITISLGNYYRLQPKYGYGELTYVIQGFAGYGNVFPALLRPGCSGYNITYYWVGDNSPHYVTAGDSPYCDVTAQDLLDGRGRYAVDDAIIRLFNNLGGDGTQADPILVQLPPTVNIVFVSMGNIPGLFQPITITLRVWRES